MVPTAATRSWLHFKRWAALADHAGFSVVMGAAQRESSCSFWDVALTTNSYTTKPEPTQKAPVFCWRKQNYLKRILWAQICKTGGRSDVSYDESTLERKESCWLCIKRCLDSFSLCTIMQFGWRDQSTGFMGLSFFYSICHMLPAVPIKKRTAQLIMASGGECSYMVSNTLIKAAEEGCLEAETVLRRCFKNASPQIKLT